MKFSSPWKNGIITGFAFFLTVAILSIGYATFSSGLSTTDRVGAGSGLTVIAWNKIVDSIVELDGRTFGLTSSGGNIGVGTSSPGAKLEVNGQIKINGWWPWVWKILLSDTTGLATWNNRSNYVIASGQSGVNVCVGNGAWALHPYNNTLTIVTSGKPLRVTAQVRQYKLGTCGRGYLAVRVDGILKTDPSDFGAWGSYECNATAFLSTILNLSAGSHTIELMGKADSGTSVCSYGTFDYLMAEELF